MLPTIIHVNKKLKILLSVFSFHITSIGLNFQLAKLSQNKTTKYFSIIWDGFLSLLTDTNLDVMLAIATNLLKIFIACSRDPNDGLCNGAICSIPAVRYQN